MAVAISMAMAAGLALTGCGSTGTTGVSAETSAGGKNEAGRNTAGNTAGGQEESQSGAGAAQVTDTKKGGKDGGTSLIFTTGGDQGTYYGFGGVLAGKIGESTSTSVTAITSGGSQANIEALDAHDADLGFVQSDVMAYAYNGTNLFEEYGKVADFSTVAALYMEQVQIVTLDPSIQSVADLEGKNVSVGAAGVISVSSNIIPAEMSEMLDLALAGDFKGALKLHQKYYCLFRDQFVETNPIPIKAAMAMAGMIAEEYRLPLCELSPEHREKLAASLKRCGILK